MPVFRPRLLLLLLSLLPACAPRTDAGPAGTLIDEQLELGNASYAAGDATGALAAYRAALATDSTFAAAWYGVFMANRALGDSAAARDALERVERLAPEAAWREHPHGPAGRGSHHP